MLDAWLLKIVVDPTFFLQVGQDVRVGAGHLAQRGAPTPHHDPGSGDIGAVVRTGTISRAENAEGNMHVRSR